MKKLRTFDLWRRPLAGIFKELLRTEGLVAWCVTSSSSPLWGETPFTECYPELWVIADEAYPHVRVLLDGWLAKPDGEAAETWTCQFCGET
ncbi:hypothetical protein [Geopsychrobacter electrodiphilus]|uniref:hypothetical protein n=1 Tax=Geopsychrobacter electrodiphilus TaxID=225196 RepID=UPI0012EC1191|nr:hypothetical protein [Geopsychrobacter electrodiphilus]